MRGMETETKERGLRNGGLVAAAALIAFIAVGCGKQEKEVAETGTASGIAATQQSGTADGSAGTRLAEATPAAAEPVSTEEGTPVVSADSLAPEIVASIPDGLVLPGGIVEITAQGSTDVVEVALSDGIGTKRPLVYDPAAGTWRGIYRVPLKTHTDRLGLSVTAKNGHGRWRRVWVFIPLQKGDAPADSTSGC